MAQAVTGSPPSRPPRRGPTLAGSRVAAAVLAVAGLLIGGASLAWACSAQAFISITPGSGPSGSRATVKGSRYFEGKVDIRWETDSGRTVHLVRAQGPSFSKQITIPEAEPGWYTVIGVHTTDDGTSYKAADTFQVTGETSSDQEQSSSGGTDSRTTSGGDQTRESTASGPNSRTVSGGDSGATDTTEASQDEGSQDTSQQSSTDTSATTDTSGSAEQTAPSETSPDGSAETSTQEGQASGSDASGGRDDAAPESPSGQAPEQQGAAPAPADSTEMAGGGGRGQPAQRPGAGEFDGPPSDRERAQPGGSGRTAAQLNISRDDRVATRGSGEAPSLSGQSAGADLWSGFDRSEAPSSLAPGIRDVHPAAPGAAGSHLAPALGLLAGGLSLLLVGLAAAGLRRRLARTG